MYHGIKNNYNKSDKAYEGTIKKCLEKVQYLEDKILLEGGELWFLFDNHDSKANIRCELSDDYKYNRKDMPDSFYQYIEIFKSFLLSYKGNYVVSYIERLEADDLVKPILDLEIVEGSVLMISSDLDWARLINYKSRDIDWYNYEEIINKDSFYGRFNFYPTPNRVTLFKTLKGDINDNIKVGLPSLEDEELYYILSKYEDALDLLTKGISDKNLGQNTRRRISENSTKIRVNWNLVDFVPLDKIGSKLKDHIYYGRFKRNNLKKYYKMLNINLASDDRYKEELNKQGSFFTEQNIARK